MIGERERGGGTEKSVCEKDWERGGWERIIKRDDIVYFAACFKLMCRDTCRYTYRDVYMRAQITRKKKIPMTVSDDSVNILLMLKYLLLDNLVCCVSLSLSTCCIFLYTGLQG